MKGVTISGLRKSFKDETVIDDLSVEIEPGEFFVVIGPTGCGKTTFLKLIAGLIQPDAGEILFDGESMEGLSPPERRIRMVFEDHALYPHLKVHSERGYSNLNFPLKLKQLTLGKIKERVMNVAERLGIGENLFDRKPGELSEGQKQQVALGRALTLPPEVILFDEPLRDLDPGRRNKAREEVLNAHKDFEATSIYVTHELAEGFSLGERVAIMQNGKFVQIDTPEEILENPKNDFVSSFTESYQKTYRDAFGEK